MIKKLLNKIIFILFFAMFFPDGGFAADNTSAKLKKVLILDFINIEKLGNYNYLESSITDAVREKLKENYVFKETKRLKWEKTANENHIYRHDYYTKTAAMNLGLLANQDIVISGGFKIKETVKKKKEKESLILTEVSIYDISKRKVISTFTIKGFADSRIWNSIGEIAKKITDKTKDLLPSKEKWEKSGILEEEKKPIFDNFTLGVRGGAGIYFNGWITHFEPKQPALTAVISFNIPYLLEALQFQTEATHFSHQMKEDAISALNDLKLTTITDNFVIGEYLLYEIPLTSWFTVSPKAGGGIVLQLTEVIGQFPSNHQNSFYFAGGGLEMGFRFLTYYSAIISAQTIAEFEKEVITYYSHANLGINYRF